MEGKNGIIIHHEYTRRYKLLEHRRKMALKMNEIFNYLLYSIYI